MGLCKAPEGGRRAIAVLQQFFPTWGTDGDAATWPGSSADDDDDGDDDDDDGGDGGGGGGGGGGGDDDAPSVRWKLEDQRQEQIRGALQRAEEVARSAATWAAVAPAPLGSSSHQRALELRAESLSSRGIVDATHCINAPSH